MVSFDATILIQLINFLVLLFLLNMVFFQPIIKIQKERQASLDSDREATDAKRKELKQLKEDYSRKLDSARQDAFELVSTKIDAANQARQQQMEAVQAEVDEKMTAAKQELEVKEQELRTALQAEVAPLAQMIFNKLVGEKQEAKV